MRIDIAKLREAPIVYEVDFGPKYLAEGSEEGVRFEAGRGSVTFRMVGDKVLADGSLRTTVHLPCARCLGEAAVPVEASVNLFYWPEDKEASPRNADAEVEEPDYGVYKGESLEPDEDLRQLLLVEVPDVALCREDCKGLCPECGANLNNGPCGCAPPGDRAEDDAGGPSWKKRLRDLKPDEKK